jgi:hypothetical protein
MAYVLSTAIRPVPDKGYATCHRQQLEEAADLDEINYDQGSE